jgi:hypothetical protein
MALDYPTIDSAYILAAIQQGRACMASNMLSYYNKLVGGVACSSNEQLKLSILLYVLEDIYKTDSTCVVEADLRIFINYIHTNCVDCGFALPTTTSAPSSNFSSGGSTTLDAAEGDGTDDVLNYILLEDGTYITFEDGTGSHLLEN